jgi:hypothetical protein
MENKTGSDNYQLYMNACAKYGDLQIAIEAMEEEKMRQWDLAKELFDKIKGTKDGEKK